MASSKLLLQIAVAALVACSVLGTFNFVSIGDWGCVPIGGYHEQDELIVAKSFQQAATDLDARFVLNTGDNFYYCGIHSKDDAALEQHVRERLLRGVDDGAVVQLPGQPRLRVPRVGDCADGVRVAEPQPLGASGAVLLQAPGVPRRGEHLAAGAGRDAVPERLRERQPEVLGPVRQRDPRLPWVHVPRERDQAELQRAADVDEHDPADDPVGRLEDVMVHAPAGDINVVDLITPLQNTGFDLYINGHVHLLTHYTMDNAGTYITTGAGCMVRVPGTTSASSGSTSSTDGVTSKKLAEVPPLKWSPSSCPSSSTNGHSCQVVFEKVIAGYTTHKFNDDFTQLSTYFYDYDGNLLHTAVTTKGGSPTPSGGSSSSSGAAPTPSSGSSSSSSGNAPSSSSAGSSGSNTCCYFNEYECYVGQICCNAEGESYKESECKGDDGKAHDCKWKDSQCIVE
eukprot:CAMPEP_0176444976 /NCGR_PEP_ID=MMETSP0127-20121128/23403_1 /TAXON_ID=938130 /ORGANISM="Platyophrya macrostoma, Strain WH" /LENGTH=453 /DNA_ID=CAMNT_0017830627 /DNA_START=95 /DNA_END=1456 /DNA_ORIENTATION=+